MPVTDAEKLDRLMQFTASLANGDDRFTTAPDPDMQPAYCGGHIVGDVCCRCNRIQQHGDFCEAEQTQTGWNEAVKRIADRATNILLGFEAAG